MADKLANQGRELSSRVQAESIVAEYDIHALCELLQTESAKLVLKITNKLKLHAIPSPLMARLRTTSALLMLYGTDIP